VGREARLSIGEAWVDYVDVATPMLGGAPQPPRDLFTVDGLHLSSAGYALWTSVLRPILLRDLADLHCH